MECIVKQSTPARDAGFNLRGAALQSSCRAGLQTRTHPIWRLGSRQYSRSGDRRYNLRISFKRVVAGQAILQFEKAARKRLFGLGEHRHVHRALAATQHRAQSDHQPVHTNRADRHCRRASLPDPPNRRKTAPVNLHRRWQNPPARVSCHAFIPEVSPLVLRYSKCDCPARTA